MLQPAVSLKVDGQVEIYNLTTVEEGIALLKALTIGLLPCLWSTITLLNGALDPTQIAEGIGEPEEQLSSFAAEVSRICKTLQQTPILIVRQGYFDTGKVSLVRVLFFPKVDDTPQQ